MSAARTSSLCYVVSKYIDGIDLAKKVGQQSRLSIDEAVKLVATVAEALHHAHKQARWCTGTSSPATFCSTKVASRSWPTLGWPCVSRTWAKGPRYAGTPAYMSPPTGSRRRALG